MNRTTSSIFTTTTPIHEEHPFMDKYQKIELIVVCIGIFFSIFLLIYTIKYATSYKSDKKRREYIPLETQIIDM